MKRLISTTLLTIACLLLFTACSSSRPAPSPTENGGATQAAYHKISAEKAKEMMVAGGVTIVDVRTAAEYAEKHIPGAVLVPNESIGSQAPSALSDQDAVLLVYCRTGVRSKQASDKLISLGYTQVYDFGGIVDWPYETESGATH